MGVGDRGLPDQALTCHQMLCQISVAYVLCNWNLDPELHL